MTRPRDWWRNCALATDDEMRAIDAMEDRLGTLSPEATGIRTLIASLELCHHKAERWIDNILRAIGTGEPGQKGLGTRPSGARHPVEDVWADAVDALEAWCAAGPDARPEGTVGGVPAARLLAGLGERTPLRRWQVQRVIERIRTVASWVRVGEDPSAEYTWLLLDAGEHEVAYRSDCPEPHAEHEDFWWATARTVLHDTQDGDEATLSLALAIDMLWPCHRSFALNLRIVLDAIGGELHPRRPFAACGRNLTRVANRERVTQVSRILAAFCSDAEPTADVDPEALELLGAPSPVKKWLAASLDKTLRLQLDPPADMNAASSLTGPDWIRETTATREP